MEHQLYMNIVSNPDICNGKATFKGTRITVKTIMEFVLAGDEDADILKSYPALGTQDIQAAKEFTAMLLEKPSQISMVKE